MNLSILAFSLNSMFISDQVMLGSCLNCHSNTISKDSTIPIISGLPAWYTQKRLFELKSSNNYYGAMSLIAKSLSNDEISKYALLLSQMTGSDEKLQATKSYEDNCASCHNAPGQAPNLQYQNPTYLQIQLDRYISKERTSSKRMLRAIEKNNELNQLLNFLAD